MVHVTKTIIEPELGKSGTASKNVNELIQLSTNLRFDSNT